MPLLVSDYSWTQNDSTVHINVPLKGAKAVKVDIVCTDEYLKVKLSNSSTDCDHIRPGPDRNYFE
uniref:CS domain-containing protein n=1 Tax=Acanthochromis polyacanthus TaxID=80966 RepID=A0A3Q1GQA4_9TELE